MLIAIREIKIGHSSLTILERVLLGIAESSIFLDIIIPSLLSLVKYGSYHWISKIPIKSPNVQHFGSRETIGG